MNGKGDLPRPLSVPRKTFENNWDFAFGQKRENVPALTEKVDQIEYDTSVIEKCRKPFMLMQKLKDHFELFGENNRGLRESDNTPEASGSTIQTPSNI